MTKVVNVRRTGDFDVYIGRGNTYGLKGPFGNPYAKGKMCSRCGEIHKTGASTLPCYRSYFYEKVKSDPEFRKSILKLRGQVLGCFCKPNPCHGDIIVEWLEANNE